MKLPSSMNDLWNPHTREIIHGSLGAGLTELAEHMQHNPPPNAEVRRAWQGGDQDQILGNLLQSHAADAVKEAAIYTLVANAISREDPLEEPDITSRFPEACEVLASSQVKHQRLLQAMDEKDQELEKQGKIFFILHHPVPAEAARHTVGFWINYWRRWKQIRCRIFLETIELNEALRVQGGDAAKFHMAALRLCWTPMELASMLSQYAAPEAPRGGKTSTQLYATFSKPFIEERGKKLRIEAFLHKKLRPVPGEFLGVARRARALCPTGKIKPEHWKTALKEHRKRYPRIQEDPL